MEMNAQILVTGGAGYIGSHTTVELINAGFEVVIIDNFSNSRKAALDGIAGITLVQPGFEEFDLCDAGRVDDFFQRHPRLKAVIHFAASKAVGESVQQPLKYYHNNLLSLINVLKAMSAHRVAPLVFSSSCTVYGQPEILPVTEQQAVRSASSPYGNTKQICEEIIRDTVAAEGNLRSISLRYFNPIGAHPSALIGELPAGVPGNLVPFVTQTAIGLREELQIFGTDYATADGTAIRDYINVVDLAKAHVAAVNRLLNHQPRVPLEIFNIGTGSGLSVMQIVEAFEQVTGQRVNRRFVGRREGDIEKIWADTGLANRELGWKAEQTLPETLLSAWHWEQRLREQSSKTRAALPTEQALT